MTMNGALDFVTAGESHGPQLTAVIIGLPAGLPLDLAELNRHLARRQRGYGRGARVLTWPARPSMTRPTCATSWSGPAPGKRQPAAPSALSATNCSPSSA